MASFILAAHMFKNGELFALFPGADLMHWKMEGSEFRRTDN
jgi:hypothetical protein